MVKVYDYGKHISIKSKGLTTSASLGVELPLKKISSLSNTKFHSQTNGILTMEIKKLGVEILIFSNGNLIFNGAKTLEDNYKALDFLIKNLSRIEIKVKRKARLTVQNLA